MKQNKFLWIALPVLLLLWFLLLLLQRESTVVALLNFFLRLLNFA